MGRKHNGSPALLVFAEVTFERDELTASGGVVEYGVHVSRFVPGRPGHPLDPATSDDEIELANAVTVYVDGRQVGVATLADCLLTLAADWRKSLDEVWREIEAACIEQAAEDWSERDADARASWAEDRAEAGRWL